MEDGPSRSRMHKPDEVAPLEAMLHGHQRPLPVDAPDLVQDRLEANAVLVDRPELDLGLQEDGRNRTEQRTQTGNELGLCRRVGADVARTGLAPAGAKPPQVTPAGLAAHVTPRVGGDPGRYGATTPAVALRMRPCEGLAQVRLLASREHVMARRRGVAPGTHPIRSVAVVALCDLADPVGGVACRMRHCGGRHADLPPEMTSSGCEK